jgi:hypothetical protein
MRLPCASSASNSCSYLTICCHFAIQSRTAVVACESEGYFCDRRSWGADDVLRPHCLLGCCCRRVYVDRSGSENAISKAFSRHFFGARKRPAIVRKKSPRFTAGDRVWEELPSSVVEGGNAGARFDSVGAKNCQLSPAHGVLCNVTDGTPSALISHAPRAPHEVAK